MSASPQQPHTGQPAAATLVNRYLSELNPSGQLPNGTEEHLNLLLNWTLREWVGRLSPNAVVDYKNHIASSVGSASDPVWLTDHNNIVRNFLEWVLSIAQREANSPPERGAIPTSTEKGRAELNYWNRRAREEGVLRNHHYKQFYTSHFGLSESDWAGKVVMDIGCGPRGSLEWAHMAKERYGLDPLAESYLELGARFHSMKYVPSGSESIPFGDGTFDIVSSFNSLDHVDDVDRTITEIKRVTKPGGLFLLLTDVGHDPTPAEPIVLDFDVVEKFVPEFELECVSHFEKRAGGLYESVLAGLPYDHENPLKRYGIVSAKFRRRA